jgi:hypothetical protein
MHHPVEGLRARGLDFLDLGDVRHDERREGRRATTRLVALRRAGLRFGGGPELDDVLGGQQVCSRAVTSMEMTDHRRAAETLTCVKVPLPPGA